MILDEPHLRLAGLSLWVWSFAYPDGTDDWDADWLRATAVLSAPGCRVTVDETFLRSDDLLAFRGDLGRLYDSLEGEAVLAGLEPNLRCRVTCRALGHLDVAVDLTPDLMHQSHSVSFEIDQTYLPRALAELGSLTARFPVRGRP